MEDLSKTQLVLLFILISIVVSFTTAIVMATLFEQSPTGSVTQTIQRVVEKTIGEDKNADGGNSKETIRIISEESRVIEVVKNFSPAVVSIIASKDLPILQECSISPFNDFFPEFKIPQLCQKGTEKRQVSAGSGFIVRKDGLIVSNRHVVEDKAADYTVILKDQRKLSAKVLIRDPLQDIALLKIEGNNFAYFSLGNSDTVQLGQRAIAIGNALGEFQNTVSVGVISGLRRNIVASGEELPSVLQTDAAINPGNSGGPLLNLEGHVIGVNTAVAPGAENIGFALPINLVKDDISKFEKTGKITYPFLGVRAQVITEAVQKEKKLAVTQGALILEITPASPAAIAGLKAADIITELGRKKVTQDNTLIELVKEHQVGDSVAVKYIRDGKEFVIPVTLEERKF